MSSLVHRIDRVQTGSSSLFSRLKSHPAVASVQEGGPGEGLTFWQGDWKRGVSRGKPSLELAGLVELMDNNPLVCADSASVPDSVSTLVLLAIGPLIDAGLLLEAPVAMTNAAFETELTEEFLRKAHWDGGIFLERAELALPSGVAVNVFAKVRTPNDLEDIDALYEERYGRSFYVRRDDNSEWDVRLVKDQPHALYRLRITPGDSECLLTIQTLADEDGKCGSAQVIHAMNVMAGLEESLGIQ